MNHDPIESLLRLRRLAVDEARRGLADSLRSESEAARTIAAVATAIEREADAASNLAVGDAEVEAFAAWLRRIRPKQEAAHAAADAAETATAQARIVLGAAQSAVRAAEELLARHAAELHAQAERQVQAELDEVAGRVRQD